MIPPNDISVADLRGLDAIGNVDQMADQHGTAYRYRPRAVKPVGLLARPGICLKVYHLIRIGQQLEAGTAEGLEGFVARQIEAGTVDVKQGMGFVMLGQGFVSINCWGRGNGLFAHNFSRTASSSEMTLQPFEVTAIACTWDIQLMYFESRLWHFYLRSRMLLSDKLLYLSTFVEGEFEGIKSLEPPPGYVAGLSVTDAAA
jgi:hypothetical protein